MVLGPGIEEFPELPTVWKDFPKPMVVDAGGIHLLAKYQCEASSYVRVLTPHSAEAARLLQVSRSKVESKTYFGRSKLQSFAFPFSKDHIQKSAIILSG